MCGILGCTPVLEKTKFKNGLNAISHRGPDGEGYWADEIIQLGHRRLSIIDLSDAGSQPKEFENILIVFNGEIFNYLEIQNELKGIGYFFQTESDTEVLLKAFHSWGMQAFHKFNGMWAIAIYDKKQKSLILSRDRYGVKPLYYFFDKNQLIFASEIQAIHKILGKNHPLNKNAIASTIEGKPHWHGSDQTFLENVFILKGGNYIEFKERNNIKVTKWYELTKIEIPKNFHDQASQLSYLIKDACQIRLRSDVPVGTCLSGGLDSGAITATINSLTDQFGNYTHRSFCAAFPNLEIDESAKALRLAAQLGTKLDIVNIQCPSPEELEQALRTCDGPMHALAFYPIWKLYKHIREQGIIVTLDGQGPDEMLGGYRPVPSAIQTAIKLRDFSWLRDIYHTYGDLGETKDFSSKATVRKYFLHTLLVPKFLNKKKVMLKYHPYSDYPLDEDLYQQFFKNPLPAILQQYDRCSMANGVECRMPFMDYRVVEFIFSLPVKSKIGGGYTKRILREALKDTLPIETRLDKQKIGFNAPIVDWYRGSLKNWMLDLMSSKDFLESSWFDGKRKYQSFEKFLRSPRPQWREAWSFWGSVHFVWWKNNNTNF